MTKVLVAIDGSVVSERAAAGISSWARESRAELTLLSVFDAGDVRATVGKAVPTFAMTPHGTATGTLLGVEDPRATAVESRSQALVRARAEREAYLQEIARRYFEGLAPTSMVLSGDDPAEVIVQAAIDRKVDLVVVGSHGRSGLTGALLGSTAQRVVRTATVPVLVVGPSAKVDMEN